MDKFTLEVLRNIFRRTLPDKRSEKHSITYSASVSAPLTISHVCQSWRKLALSYGELWAHLYIDFRDGPEKEDPETVIDVFDTWLRRSNETPLNYSFKCNCSPCDKDHRAAQKIVRALIKEKSRWKDVDFYWAINEASSNFPGDISLTNMPLLTSLNLFTRMYKSIFVIPWVTVDISRSPRLQRLELDGDFKLMTQGKRFPALTEFISFSFGRTYWGSLAVLTSLQLLGAAPNLTGFRATFECDESEPELESIRLHHTAHNHLRNLSLTYHYARIYVLDHLTIPSLEALSVAYDNRYEGGEKLLGFFRRSSPALTTLTIIDCRCDEDTLVRILKLIPTLKELRVSDLRLSTGLFQALTVTNDAEGGSQATEERTLCPALVSLHLRLLLFPKKKSGTCIDALLRMVKSRWEILGTFKRVIIKDERIDIPNITRKTIGTHIEDDILIVEGDNVPPYPFSESSWE